MSDRGWRGRGRYYYDRTGLAGSAYDAYHPASNSSSSANSSDNPGTSSYRGRGSSRPVRGSGGSFRGRGDSLYYSRGGSSRYQPYYLNRGRDVYRTGDRTYDEPEDKRPDEEYAAEDPRSHSYNSNYRGGFRGGFRGSLSNYRGRGYYNGSGGRPSITSASSHEYNDGYNDNRQYDKSRSSLYTKNYNDNTQNSRASTPASERLSISKSRHSISKPEQKVFKNPWIPILHIKDPKTQAVLESRYEDLLKVDKELSQLQLTRFKLQNSVQSLDRSMEREALHVQLTNEKLEEFTFLQ